MIRFLQINLIGKSAAQDLTLQRAREQTTDVLIESEYYKYGNSTNEANGWYCDKSSRAAIVNCSDVQIDEIGKAENGFTWITTENLRIYTCYISPSTTVRQYKHWLAELKMNIRTATGEVLLARVFNARHRSWGPGLMITKANR